MRASVTGAWAARVLPLDRPTLIRAGLLTLAYAAAAAASLRWLTAGGVGMVIWPPAGIALAALALGGARLWPGVLLGQLLASLAAGQAPGPADLIVATGMTLAALLPALALRRQKLAPDLATLHAMLWLVVAGGLGGAALSAGAGMAAMALNGVALSGLGPPAMLWAFGHLAGVLLVTPALLSWRPGGGRPLSRVQGLHLALAVAVTAVVSHAIFLSGEPRGPRSWLVFPVLVWPALAFSIRGASLGLVLLAVMAFAADILGIGPLSNMGLGAPQTLLTQQFTIVVAVTILVLAAVADERRGQDQLRASEQRLREESEALEVLNRSGAAIASELDLDAAVLRVTEAGVALSGAEFGAFFYNVTDEAGESFMLYALSGAPRSAFDRFGQPRNTAVFAATFSGEGVVRSDDITKDPRYGHNPPHRGMPKGHLPVRSYLAAPVKSRSGEVIGGLFFGHQKPGMFTERSERLIVGVAAQAAIAIDNGRLYQAAQRELAERRRAEEHQRLLMNELNHRVKNTLATVQSMGAQSMRTGRSLAEAREAFVSRLIALSSAHNLLTAERWESADLEDVVRLGVAAFDEPPGARFEVSGGAARLRAPHALGLAMALHELGSNAQKYGALSVEGGTVRVSWTVAPDGLTTFVWEERGGPEVQPPVRRGFGSRLIKEGLARELQAEVRMDYPPEGLRCELVFRLDTTPAPDLSDVDSPGGDLT